MFATERNTGVTHAKAQMMDTTEHPINLDSHADTCIVGKNVLIDHVLDKKVNVTDFDPAQGKVRDLNLVTAALAYDCPRTGEVSVLMVHQAVHVPTRERFALPHADANERCRAPRVPKIHGGATK